MLEGLLVADFSRVLAGPLCTQMLGDAGARVIKVEEPQRGDETRHWGPPFAGGESAYFLSLNRNKESVAIDLKSREGRELAKQLIRRADVVIDNFRKGQRADFGLAPATVRKLNRRAILCSISGFESGTSEESLPGYDLLAQASAGLMAITGEPEGLPTKAGVALSDVLTAHYAFGAICAALFDRERSGKGRSIEVSLFGATLASLVNVAQSALLTGKEAGRFGNAHPSIVPYQTFAAADRFFALAVGTNRHFDLLCRKVVKDRGLTDDERYRVNEGRVEHREELISALSKIFRTKRAKVWVDRCIKADIPATVVESLSGALARPSAAALLDSCDHPSVGRYLTVGNPLRIDGKRLPLRSAPPLLGADTANFLREFGRGGKKR